MIAPMAGKVLENRLHNFQQWSDFSEGYPSPEALLAGCPLDASGKVTSPIAMTEIIAESYVASAQVYLQCRLFRYDFIAPKDLKILVSQFCIAEGSSYPTMDLGNHVVTLSSRTSRIL